jgi:hypothetical protein
MISPALRPFLDDLEARLDVEQEERLLREWQDFTAGRVEEGIFTPRRDRVNLPRIEWPAVKINPALSDYDSMALQQFGAVSQTLADVGGALLNVRCNYGSSILPSLFGVEMYIMDAELDTLPTSVPLNNLDAVRALVARGVPAPTAGWGERVLEMGRRYAEILSEYPNIARCVRIYHPDLQGPMDVVEVIWGSTVFYSLYDHPDLVHTLLDLVCQTYTRFMRAWNEIVPFDPTGNSHWGLYHRGNLMLRDDSAMNLSKSMFDEFIRPYDQRLLDEFGGGAIHFCGKGDHYIASMGEISGLYAINLSQPHLNNMERIYAATVDRGINIIGFDRATAEATLAAGRDLRGRVHCH